MDQTSYGRKLKLLLVTQRDYTAAIWLTYTHTVTFSEAGNLSSFGHL
jgi:hypothetical protein